MAISVLLVVVCRFELHDAASSYHNSVGFGALKGVLASKTLADLVDANIVPQEPSRFDERLEVDDHDFRNRPRV